ncbi:flagellar assembly protein FliH [Erwinia sp. CPCC 100877]|nr:flagellar assembly protein FliH [Erwinia sp. CPCC 100877]
MSDERLKNDWRRWMPEDLGSPFAPLEELAPMPEVNEERSPEETREELMRLRHQAQQQGYNEGLKKGEEEGHAQGYERGLELGKAEGIEQGLAQAKAEQQEMIDQFASLLRDFKVTMESLDEVIPARLVQVALTAARQVIGQAPVCDASALVDQVHKLLHEETLFNGQPQLWVSPEDYPLVQEQLGETLENHGWRLYSDGKILRGGCRICSTDGELDATLGTRWEALCNLVREESVV